MGAIFVFIFKSGLVMMALYLAYRLFLAKAKQPTFNRVVLLLIYIVSPLAILLSEARFGNTTMPAGYLPAIEAVGTRHGASCADSEWPVAILYLWIAGIAVASVAIAVSIINLRRSIRRCSTRRAGSIRVAISDNEGVAPFSTARTIVLSRSDRDDAGSMIIKHELQHIRLLHWLDLAIGHIVAVISWYNPVSWLMIAELKEVHEFQVDKRVISMGVNAREYQYMLLQKPLAAQHRRSPTV